MIDLTTLLPAEAEYFDEQGCVQKAKLTYDRNGDSILCADSAAGVEFNVVLNARESSLTARVPKDSIRETKGMRLKNIILFPGLIGGQENDGGALVLPLDSGRLCHTKGKETAEYWLPHFRAPSEWQVYWSNMNVIGQYADGKARAAVIEGGRLNAQLRVRTNFGKSGLYSIDIAFSVRDVPEEGPENEDFSLVYGELPGDYRAVAQFYRDYNVKSRGLPTIKQKAQGNPDLDYSARALTVRCRMCVKPLPCKIAEQTPENEPPVNVFLTFADIRKIADEFARQKVGAAEFNLVGWNHGGHDGAFPQLFPVEEALGGEAELRKTIEYVKNLGYHISLHDNYYDGYSLARNFDMADRMVLNEKTAFVSNCGLLGGGKPYRVCPKPAAEKYAPSNFPKCADLGINGAYFVDVISIIGLEKCYSDKHPVTRDGNADCYKKILRMQQDFFKVSMSEGARDWALPELDRAYMILNCMDIPLGCADEIIPLFSMVYHDFLIYNNFREGINTFPGERLYLLNLAWGGIPMIYFHHLFNPAWKADTGWAKDLTFETPEKLTKDVASIKRMTDDIARLAPLRYVPIVDIVSQGDLSQTVYENGVNVWANFSEEPKKTPEGDVVPAMDFIVI